MAVLCVWQLNQSSPRRVQVATRAPEASTSYASWEMTPSSNQAGWTAGKLFNSSPLKTEAAGHAVHLSLGLPRRA